MKNEEIQQKTGATAVNSGAKNDNLIQWLNDPRTAEFFGDTFKLRADVLAAVTFHDNFRIAPWTFREDFAVRLGEMLRQADAGSQRQPGIARSISWSYRSNCAVAWVMTSSIS